MQIRWRRSSQQLNRRLQLHLKPVGLLKRCWTHFNPPQLPLNLKQRRQ